jgi:membrane-associated phospholipid phosphatase
MEAPPSMILMPDPIIQAVASNTGELLTRDLFFSGHTSVMFMAAFLMPTSRERWLFVALGIVVGTSLVLQHVHYTVDVVVAPMAAMFAVVLSGRRK